MAHKITDPLWQKLLLRPDPRSDPHDEKNTATLLSKIATVIGIDDGDADNDAALYAELKGASPARVAVTYNRATYGVAISVSVGPPWDDLEEHFQKKRCAARVGLVQRADLAPKLVKK